MPEPRAAVHESDDDLEVPPANRQTVGRPPVISLDDILGAATRLAEEVGVDGLTMNLVGDRLGVTSAALYHYVENKQDLINKVFDRALERVVAPPAEAGTWDQRLRLFQASIRTVLRRLKWGTPQPIIGDPQPPEAVTRLAGSVMEILSETGADEHDIRLAFTMVYVYFTGQLWYDNSTRHMSFDPEPQELRVSADDPAQANSDELFDFSFDIILAGLRERLTPEPGPSALPPRRDA